MNPWHLSSQEETVIDLFACGRDTKQIAAMLAISRRTVENYRAIASQKMGVPGNYIRASVIWDRYAMGRDEEAA